MIHFSSRWSLVILGKSKKIPEMCVWVGVCWGGSGGILHASDTIQASYNQSFMHYIFSHADLLNNNSCLV